ncbi:Protein TusB [Arsenophonus endosymbiont of Aleurodicus floccissimus]|uniref:sulfurtransferase complex subunit TusB n=1 Tax=Arsenophonus endosymbiont of Aleurodicus floccissimus TaxID=2152761 RepID=UPI000E6AFC92|nr:sulfurtransferase complex subunit TusB [Arsenophonus endosymbiont of Aleurodicus floccissimus]SPP31761.1 Protein TusB [Arsenophonus endosymbiont of Aleurodicus floccissimus]
MLYTISTSPYYNDFDSLISLLTELDEVLLLQDGVLLGHKISSANKDNNFLMQLKDKGIQVFALQNDVEARGLMPYMSSYVRQISSVDFVQLTVKHPQYFAW